MSTFKNYFDGIDTKTNTAAECGEIRAKASKIKKRRKIFSSAAGVTLAVMMTTTVAVSAAGGWDITEIIGRWFKGNTESVMDNLSEVTVLELEEKNFDSLEITPRGAVSDDNVIVLFMDVTRTDGGIFEDTEYEVTDKEGNIAYDNNGEPYKLLPWYSFGVSQAKVNVAWTAYADDRVYNHKWDYDMNVRQYRVDDGSPNDNKMTMAFCFDKTNIKETLKLGAENADIIENMRIEDITLRLCNLRDTRDRFMRKHGDGSLFKQYYAENVPFIWNATLSMNFPPLESITAEPNSEATFKITDNGGVAEYDYSYTVKNISVSKISLSFDLEAPRNSFDSYLLHYDIADIILKNGDVIEVAKEREFERKLPYLSRAGWYTDMDGNSTRFEHVSFILTEPIDPDEVAAVRLGDTTFPIE